MDTPIKVGVPAEVAKAIVSVMAGVKMLGKEDTNKFQKYEFVSVDKFLAAIGPLCATAELVIFQEEESIDISSKETSDDYGKTKTSSWLTARYAFTLAHSSGASYGPLHRSVMVPANGAQAFGSAQSYALKQFMRAQFQIPTGDKDDADHQPAETLPSGKANGRANGKTSGTPFDNKSEQKPAAASFALDPDNKKTDENFGLLLMKAIAKADCPDKLSKLERDNEYRLENLGGRNRQHCNDLRMAFTARFEDLNGGEAA